MIRLLFDKGALLFHHRQRTRITNLRASVAEGPIALPPIRQSGARLMVEPKITPTNLIAPIQCPRCSEKGYIIQRWHDPFSRDRYSEVWTFQCVNGHNTEKAGHR
jgi:hypothetical protein